MRRTVRPAGTEPDQRRAADEKWGRQEQREQEQLVVGAAHIHDVLQRLVSGALRVTIARIYPLEQAATAHDDLEHARVTGKVLLQP